MPYGPYGETFEQCVAKVSSWTDNPDGFCSWYKQQSAVSGASAQALTRVWNAAVRVSAGASEPLEAPIIEERRDGSGIFMVPVSVDTKRVDFSLTDGGGKVGKVTLDDLREMEGNFKTWPMPVGVGVDSDTGEPGTGHLKDFRRGPQPGFVASLTLIGKHLWAAVDAGRNLFQQFKERSWRASSMETLRDYEHPSGGKYEGWGLYGLLMTNAPALDTNFKPVCEGAYSALGVMFCAIRPPTNAGALEDEAMLEKLLKALGVKTEEEALAKIESYNKSTAPEELKAVLGALGVKSQEEAIAAVTKLKETGTKVEDAEKKVKEGEQALALVPRLESRIKTLEEQQLATATTGKAKAIKEAVAAAVRTKRMRPAEASLAAADKTSIPHTKWTDPQAIEWLDEVSWFGSVEKLQAFAQSGPVLEQFSGDPIKGGTPGDETQDTPMMALEAEAHKAMAADPKLTFDAAVQHVKRSNPKVYQAAMTARQASTQ